MIRPSQCCYITLTLLLVFIGIVRITATYPAFMQSFDEPFHIAAGMELLDNGSYDYETLHPPLARIMSALGLYLSGVHPDTADYKTKDMLELGNATLLSEKSEYTQRLTLARLGILPFFLLASCCVWLWSYRLFGIQSAFIATALFTTLPPILAHSGIATTDMAITATLTFALYRFTLWFKQPSSLSYSLWLGIASALCLLSKFSGIIFLPLAAAAIMITHDFTTKRRSQGFSLPVVKGLLLAFIAAIIVVWAGYGFSLDGMIPFPEFFNGLASLVLRNELKRDVYFMGVHSHSIWYYFPGILFFKTPLPFLAAFFIGCYFLIRQKADWERLAPLVASIAVLVAAIIFSKINIGVRHILPLYPLLAIIAGYGLSSLWQLHYGKALALLLLGWQIISGIMIHPHYLPYFNEFAGSKPENIAIDSDLDWGQDGKLLADMLITRGIEKETTVRYFGSTSLEPFGIKSTFCASYLPPTLPPDTKGWIAISISCIVPFKHKELAWLAAHKPTEIIGHSIYLYHIP